MDLDASRIAVIIQWRGLTQNRGVGHGTEYDPAKAHGFSTNDAFKERSALWVMRSLATYAFRLWPTPAKKRVTTHKSMGPRTLARRTSGMRSSTNRFPQMKRC